ncbi:hypothetical protein BWP07_07290 [Bacteroides fragilis]|nr:hypothetical protein BWP07_07290 [Bacteroides fragilis]
MMERIRSRFVPPPNPSKKSANPSSCRAPVINNRAASANNTATEKGRICALNQSTPAMMLPVSHPDKGQ